MVNNFVVKDSGNRQEFNTGSRRDTDDDKPDYTLESRHAKTRLAYHLMKGAKKYGRRNWELGQPVSCFLASLYRHIEQYAAGDRTEDHLAAALFNVGGIIHMEEEVELGRLSSSLLDLPFYSEVEDNGKTEEPDHNAALKQALYDTIALQAKENGIGYSVGTLMMVVVPQLKIAFKDMFPLLNALIAEGKLLLAHTRLQTDTGYRDVYIYFPSYYTQDEIRNRIILATGDNQTVVFESDYDPYWRERPENARYLDENFD